MSGWIGVDFDGTLVSNYDGSMEDIGTPIPAMMTRVKEFLKRGVEVRIVTARAVYGQKEIDKIQLWLVEHGLPKLKVTAQKDPAMLLLFDDRAIGVVSNTGQLSEELAFENGYRRGRTECQTNP